MTKVNLTPITKEDQPSSHVRVGRSKIGGDTDVVKLRHREREAFFRAKTEDDRVMSSIGNKVYINENVAAIFGGIDFSGGNSFVIDSDASVASVPAADEVEIYPHEVARDVLEKYLRSEEYLLHRIEEAAEIRGGVVRFTITEMSPSAYSTLRVSPDTDINFVETSAEPEPVAPGGVGNEPGTGAGGNGNAQRPTDDDPSVSLDPAVPQVNFEDDVAGLDEVKETARMLLALFDQDVRTQVIDMYGEEFANRGGSMLLYGPPGCGKTHVSEAIAYEAKYNAGIEQQYGEVTFLKIRGSDIQSKYAGESEKNVKAVFDRAHSIAQDGFAVLFFDEIETLIPDRSDDNLQRHERAVTNAFLQQMNDVEDNLFVIGATNMPFNIDPAASRRFPIQQFIPQPDEAVMVEVWQKQLSTLPNADQIDFGRLGEETVGYTPAEVADRILGSDLQRQLIRSVVNGQPQEITTEYLIECINQTEPKTIRQFVTSVRDQIDELEGYPQLRAYVEDQANQLGIDVQGSGNNALSDLLTPADGESTAEVSTEEEKANHSNGEADPGVAGAEKGSEGGGASAGNSSEDASFTGEQ